MTSFKEGLDDFNLPLYYAGLGDIVEDVKVFMRASNQEASPATAALYMKLIHEEMQETMLAFNSNDEVEVLDGICDLIWVAIGLGVAMKLPMERAWKEVRRSNYDKIGGDGKCRFREDGKVLKPTNWVAPRIDLILKDHKKEQENG